MERPDRSDYIPFALSCIVFVCHRTLLVGDLVLVGMRGRGAGVSDPCLLHDATLSLSINLVCWREGVGHVCVSHQFSLSLKNKKRTFEPARLTPEFGKEILTNHG